jgi:hypothetical protein
MGRKPNIEPATAFDYRRYILLVQVLATSESDEPIRELCALWEVEPVNDKSIPPYRGRHYLNVWATLKVLAEHAIAHHREVDHDDANSV